MSENAETNMKMENTTQVLINSGGRKSAPLISKQETGALKHENLKKRTKSVLKTKHTLLNSCLQVAPCILKVEKEKSFLDHRVLSSLPSSYMFVSLFSFLVIPPVLPISVSCLS